MSLQFWGRNTRIRWTFLCMQAWFVLQLGWAILNFGLNMKGIVLCTFLLSQFIQSCFLPISIQMLLPFETFPVVSPSTQKENEIYHVHVHTLWGSSSSLARNTAHWDVLKAMTIPDCLKGTQVPVTKYLAVKSIIPSGSKFAIILETRSWSPICLYWNSSLFTTSFWIWCDLQSRKSCFLCPQPGLSYTLTIRKTRIRQCSLLQYMLLY